MSLDINPEAKAELDRIVNTEPNSLSESDVAFLKARRDYLTKEQLETFASVLTEKPVKAEKPVKE